MSMSVDDDADDDDDILVNDDYFKTILTEHVNF